MNTQNNRIKKEIHNLIRQGQLMAKRDTCFLCGKPCSSFCKSHSVPRFILKNIAENGEVILQSEFIETIKAITDTKVGIKKAETFSIICNNCDSIYFQDYENEQNLSYDIPNKIMAEIALKNFLLMLYKKYTEYSTNKIFVEHTSFPMEVADETNYFNKLDTNDYEYYLKRTKKIVDNNLKSGFKLIYWKSLPYKVAIATQTLIVVHKDLYGRIVNDISDISPNIRMQEIHICIFPLQNSTSIFIFRHKDNTKYNAFERQFNKLNEEDKLKYITYLIIKYSEHFIISPKLSREVYKNNTIRMLANEIPVSTDLGVVSNINLITGNYQTTVNWQDVPNLLSEYYSI